MAGRNRMPRHPDAPRGFHEPHRPVLMRGPPGPLPIHPAALEEELEIQHREIQRILAENRHVVDDNVLLQRELTGAKDELHRLGQVIPKLRADKEVHTRDLVDRGLKLEAELRATEPLRAEVIKLRADAQKLNALRQELSDQVQGLSKDIMRMKDENQKINAMRNDIDVLRKELTDARRAFEYEKKANEEQVEQRQAMENNLISMAREIEKLRAEQLNQDRRTSRVGLGSSGSYGMLGGSPELRYPSGAFSDGYAGAWATYDKRGPPRH